MRELSFTFLISLFLTDFIHFMDTEIVPGAQRITPAAGYYCVPGGLHCKRSISSKLTLNTGKLNLTFYVVNLEDHLNSTFSN